MSMRHEEPWKKIQPLEVAMVAAALMRNEMDVAEATSKALQLIEAASYGLIGLYQHKTLTDGVDLWASQQVNRAELWEIIAKMPAEWPNPKAETMPFDDAMALLFPRHKKVDRLPIFRQWLADFHQTELVTAGEMIAKFKEQGFSESYYNAARFALQMWMEKQKSKHRSEAGKKGGTSKKRRAKK